MGSLKALKIAPIIVGAAMVGSLTACASDGAVGGESAVGNSGFVNIVETDGDAVENASITIADYAEVRSLDPAVTPSSGETGGSALAAVYDVLAYYDVEAAAYKPKLAQSVETADGGLNWIITLRPGVDFSDGTPLDAASVVSSIKRYIDRGGPDAGLLTGNIAQLSAVDGQTVAIEMLAPWSSFPSMLSQGAGMIVAASADAGEKFAPVGAGAYELGEYRPQEALTLRARPAYWDGEPRISTLNFIWPDGDSLRAEVLRHGEADVAVMRAPDTVDGLRDTQSGFIAVLNLGNLLAINGREGRPGEDPRVRQAIALAIDPVGVYERAYGGHGLPGTALFQPSSRWFDGAEQPAPDPPAASKLVAELKADGFDGKLTYVDSIDPAAQARALAIAAMLDSAGFDVEIASSPSPADTIKRIYADRDFDITVLGASVTEEDPYHRLGNLVSSKSSRNLTGISSPELDALIGELRAAQTEDDKRAVLGRVQEEWNAVNPGVVLGASEVFLAWNPQVRGIIPTAERMLLFDKAWVTE